MSSLASIDIGSNTIRLLIGRVDGNRIIRLENRMVITRLAAGINKTGLLKSENAGRSIRVLKEFSRIISEHKVVAVKAVGTSALREAKNSEEFIGKAFSETGIKIEVISGKKEAELTAKGVLFDLPQKRSSLIIDIGGGSTEWILCKNSSPVKMGTIPTGVVKLFENHIKSDLSLKDEIVSLDMEIEGILNSLKARIKGLIEYDTAFIGTAGTITTLASIDLALGKYSHEKVHGHRIPLQRLYDIREKLVSIPLNRRGKIMGLEPERADLIIPGVLFTIKIMNILGFKEILVSDNGLLEGALIHLSEEVSQLA